MQKEQKQFLEDFKNLSEIEKYELYQKLKSKINYDKLLLEIYSPIFDKYPFIQNIYGNYSSEFDDDGGTIIYGDLTSVKIELFFSEDKEYYELEGDFFENHSELEYGLNTYIDEKTYNNMKKDFEKLESYDVNSFYQGKGFDFIIKKYKTGELKIKVT